jgi:FixJ family two-component response regulator
MVCIVDDDAGVRASLARLVAAEGWNAVPYGSAGEFLERAPLAEVGCVLLDNRMPGMSGIELLERLSRGGVAPPVVVLAGNHDVATGVDAMKLGAVDFLTKPVESEVVVAAVRKALERHAGERERTRERESCRALVDRLSAREREVMAHVIRGRLNKQIAADLDIAEQTVKQHRGRVMEKIGVRSVPELVRVCEATGLFAAPEACVARDPDSH